MSDLVTANLRDNQLSAEAFAWYRRYLSAIDGRDVGLRCLPRRFHLHALQQRPPIEGKAAVLAMLAGYWQSYAALTHDLTNICGNDQRFVLEALNHYRRHDGGDITTRAVAFTDRDVAGLVTSVRVHADVSALFS